MKNHVTIELLVDIVDGEPFKESVHAEQLGPNHYRLLSSPGLLAGLAADDEIQLDSNEPSGYKLLRRGGNVAVHFFRQNGIKDCLESVEEITKIGGKLDGQTRQLLVFTIPSRIGFPVIEKALANLQMKHPDAEIIYGNVYDEDGITPLNWWNE